MLAKSKQRTGVKSNGYHVENDGKGYDTDSIVKARAYAVKMIREHEIYYGTPSKRSWSWPILHHKESRVTRYKCYSYVVYRPQTKEYVWWHRRKDSEESIPTKIYTDGRIKR